MAAKRANSDIVACALHPALYVSTSNHLWVAHGLDSQCACELAASSEQSVASSLR